MPPNTTQNADQGPSHHPNYYHPYQNHTRQSRTFDALDSTSFWNQHLDSTHPNLSSYPYIVRDSSANPGSYEGTEHPDFAFPPTLHWQTAEQSLGTIFQDTYNFNHDTANLDQQNINSWSPQYFGSDSDWLAAYQNHTHQSRRFDPLDTSFWNQHCGTTNTDPSSYPVFPQDNGTNFGSYEGTEHPISSYSYIPQDSGANLGSYEYSDFTFPSTSHWHVAEQSLRTTFRDTYNLNHDIPNINRQNINNWSPQFNGPHSDGPTTYQNLTHQSREFDPLVTSFRNLLCGTMYPNPSSYPVILQDNSTNFRSYEGTEHTSFTSPSLPSTSHWQAAGKGLGMTQDMYNFHCDIADTDQQSTSGLRMQHIGPGVYPHWPTTQAAMFERAHNFRIENAPITNIGQVVNQQHVNNSFDRLERFVSFNALHDSSAQDPERCCYPGTRESVLRQIHDWADDPTRPERILWLHGPAGVGKSAIAQSISKSYGRDKIGATFFFFRSDPMRNDGNRLFPTLAWRLASSVPIIKDHIAFSLEEDPDIPRKVIEAQFEQLIAQPSLRISGGEQTSPSFTRVIIIDGLDECSDLKLQERILKIIGNAVTDTHFPFRFILSSRPEANIQDFFNQFHSPTLQIDLANIESAFRDIEVYFTSQFARIAAEQELDPILWPGQGIINTLVSKSSGQFIYASTVTKYVGDQYENAVSQLDIVLQLRQSSGKSPFSELDALYTEILQRQPDKKFLKDYLAVLIARIALSGEYYCHRLYEDDTMLLGLDEKQLHRKLRGMHSILKFERFIDVHHKSFLDFLADSSRSSEYHVSKWYANRRYMERVVDVLIKVASRAMEEPEHHQSDHFQPEFSIILRNPLFPELALDDLEETLHPLQLFQDKLLQLHVPYKPTACNECWTFFMIDDLLLHLSLIRATTQLLEPKYVGIRPLTTVEEKQNVPRLDLDTCLSLLLANLRCEEVSLNADIIRLVRALVLFDPTEAAIKIGSRTDAQNLIDLFYCLNKNGCFKSWFGAAAQNATKLALAIYRRVPLLPRSFSATLDYGQRTYQREVVEVMTREDSCVWNACFGAFFFGCQSHENLPSFLGICFIETDFHMVFALPENVKPIFDWRRSANPSVSIVQRIFFEIAKTLQYIRSLGVVVRCYTNDIYVDSDNHLKVLGYQFFPIDICKERFDYEWYGRNRLSSDVYWFGELFDYTLPRDYSYPKVHLKEPEIPDNVWKLIRRCCAKEPEERPTIDQVVQEMESWISLGQFTLS